MSLEENLANYIKSKAINLAALSEATNIPYGSLYYSLFAKDRSRPIRGTELVAVCKFLGKDPMDFAEDEKEVV